MAKKNCGCKKHKRARVGAAKGGSYLDFDFEDIAVMAAGGLAVKALVNPLAKIVFGKSDKEGKARPKYSPILLKAGLTIGLNMINDPMAKTAAKGAAVAMLMEAADILMPKVFNPTRNEIKGYDDDEVGAIELNLDDVNIGDTDDNSFDIGEVGDSAVLGHYSDVL